VCAFLSIKLFIHVWACAATSNPSVRCTEFNEKPEIPVIKHPLQRRRRPPPKDKKRNTQNREEKKQSKDPFKEKAQQPIQAKDCSKKHKMTGY
jgi:hypothetical protein